MIDLVLATANPAKIAEYRSLLDPRHFHLLTARDASITHFPPEGCESVVDNACAKARFVAEHTGLLALADDGGLEIDALGGAPGAESRRWVGEAADDETIIAHTLRALQGVPWVRRTARFHIAICIAFSDSRTLVSERFLTGLIAEVPSSRREPGFPYRAIFWLPAFGCTYAELSPDQRALISHRRQALDDLLHRLDAERASR
ncbi:MAG: non-canonical purine NTP pyrophosphatase [Chloroflexi bacterium]|nr:non-canonical purine NTP pyrophosphatase [Chloroflexota bacterium]